MTTATDSSEAVLYTMIRSGVEIDTVRLLLLARVEEAGTGPIVQDCRKTFMNAKSEARKTSQMSHYECLNCENCFSNFKRFRAHVKTERHFASLTNIKIKYYNSIFTGLQKLECDEHQLEIARRNIEQIRSILQSIGSRERSKRSKEQEQELLTNTSSLSQIFESTRHTYFETHDLATILPALPTDEDEQEEQHDPALLFIETCTNYFRALRNLSTLERLF